MTVLRSLLALALAALALVAAGCGSKSDTTSATDWADSLCSAVNDWKSSVATAVDSVKGGNVSKDGLKDAANDVQNATNKLADDLKGLGKPDTEAGDKAKASVDDLSSSIDGEVDKIKSAVDDATNVSTTLNAVSVVGATLATMRNQVTSTITDLSNLNPQGELQDAFDEADSCKSVRQGSS